MQLQVSRSLIAPASLVPLIKENYDILGSIEISLLGLGDNHHYLVETSNTKYVLRVYGYNKYWLQTESNFLFELDWLRFLKLHDIPVYEAIQRKDKKYLGILKAPEGKRYWVLINYIKGQITKPHTNNVVRVGELIAKIHSLSNNFQTKFKKNNIDRDFLITKSYERIQKFSKDIKSKDLKLLDYLIACLNSKLQDFISNNSPDDWGVIHGDFQKYNYLTYRKEISLLDFDLCSYGWKIYDIAVFKWSLLRNRRSDSIFQSFLQGYQSIRKLTGAELEILPYFTQMRHIWLMGDQSTYTDLPLTSTYWDTMFYELRTYIIVS
jgi:Ser/Thr protein kinase RdoA (MazF antagonist)